MTLTSGQRAALYLRASSREKTHTHDGDKYRQRPETQEERLRQLCARRGWQVAAVHCDRASGRSGLRPELGRLGADARRGLFAVLAVVAFDRFVGSVRHLIAAIEEFRHLGIEFVSLRESIDTGAPMGRVMFTLIGAMAELESALISDRTTAGMECARAHGTRSGRPVGRQHRVFPRDEADNLLHQGLSYREVSRRLGVPVATLHAALQSYRRARSEKVSPRGGSPHSNDSPVPDCRRCSAGEPLRNGGGRAVIPGKHPGGRPRVPVEPEQVGKLRRPRLSWRRIAKALGISTATAMRLYDAGQPARKASQNSP